MLRSSFPHCYSNVLQTYMEGSLLDQGIIIKHERNPTNSTIQTLSVVKNPAVLYCLGRGWEDLTTVNRHRQLT